MCDGDMAVKTLYKRLGLRLVYERNRKNLSQEELAFLTAIDRTYIARIEGGKANPSIKVLNKLSRKLDLKVHELLEGV